MPRRAFGRCLPIRSRWHGGNGNTRMRQALCSHLQRSSRLSWRHSYITRVLKDQAFGHEHKDRGYASGRTPHELMSGPGSRAAVPANVAKGSLIRRGFTANACLLRGSGTVNARRTRSLAHAPAASNCCRSSTGSFRGYDPGGATAFEIYVTETKNWSGFRIFWGYKQVAWAIHRSSDSRWTYLPQAHNPGIICIERSKNYARSACLMDAVHPMFEHCAIAA